MFCENCGNLLMDNAKICNACGKVVVSVPYTETEPVNNKFTYKVDEEEKVSEVIEQSEKIVENHNITIDDIDTELEILRKERRMQLIKFYGMIDVRIYLMGLVSNDNNSNYVKILNAVRDGRVVPVYLEGDLNEYELLLRRDRFKIPETTVSSFLDCLRKNGTVATKDEANKIVVETNGFPFYEVVPEKNQDSKDNSVALDQIISFI